MTARHETPPQGQAAAFATGFAELVPSLSGERVDLRAPQVGDFDAFAGIVCGARGVYVGGPMDRDEAWLDFVQLAAGWMLQGHGGWTVTSKETGAVLGFVLLGLEPGDHEVELGFLFTEAAEGRGFAQEAALAARDWAGLALGLTSLVSYIDPANARAITMMGHMGAKRDPQAEAELNDDAQVWRHEGDAA